MLRTPNVVITALIGRYSHRPTIGMNTGVSGSSSSDHWRVRQHVR